MPTHPFASADGAVAEAVGAETGVALEEGVRELVEKVGERLGEEDTGEEGAGNIIIVVVGGGEERVGVIGKGVISEGRVGGTTRGSSSSSN